ncbi:MAG: (d)CMP kinase [Candidatus Paceibacterota bacterium]
MTKDFFHIAIDGPVAAGKGTVSKLIAHRLGFLYVDTGAMYRVTAYLAHQNKVAYDDEQKIVELLESSKMKMRTPDENEQDGRLITVFLDGEDISWKIRTEEISQGSSKVSVLSEVRKILVKKQQEIAYGQDVVMEGRDIGSRVLPEADLKIFLTANVRERAERRLLQLQLKGLDLDIQEVLREIEERDTRDMNRQTDPLKMMPDSWKLDATDLTIEQVVEKIVDKVNEMRANSTKK